MNLVKPSTFVGIVLLSYIPGFFFATNYPIIIDAISGKEVDLSTIFMVPLFWLIYMFWLYLPQLILLLIFMFLTSKFSKDGLIFLATSMLVLFLLSGLPLGLITLIGPAIVVLLRFKQMPVAIKSKAKPKTKTKARKK